MPREGLAGSSRPEDESCEGKVGERNFISVFLMGSGGGVNPLTPPPTPTGTHEPVLMTGTPTRHEVITFAFRLFAAKTEASLSWNH